MTIYKNIILFTFLSIFDILNKFCRLKLPGEIEEDDSSSCSYDCDKGFFTLTLSKVNKGEYFENLDMITTLLAPPKKHNIIAPSIEVIGKLFKYNTKV